ncbi:MAG: hypothetical protein JKX85_16180 [Phycisphaeraceae bacterium]|nr:hypothetical protein [Phycisphaeraceae bacterium]
MLIYAGIDEAGYGPLLGPLVVGRSVFALRDAEPDDAQGLPNLWDILNKAVCQRLSGRAGRIPVNDSKKLKTKAAGVKHLEMGVMSFCSVMQDTLPRPTDLGQWLDLLGETTHHQRHVLPWYDGPWQSLPTANTDAEINVAANMLKHEMKDKAVKILDMGAAVVMEDRFNHMVANTRSKASLSFTFVASHLDTIWQRWGKHHPQVVVDRQSGRTHYLNLLRQVFPDAQLTIISESSKESHYQLQMPQRSMQVRFLVDAEAANMPVALASMLSKYTREVFMDRLNHWFINHQPDLKPTAGYAQDGKRFLEDIEGLLKTLKIDRSRLARQS